MKIHELIWKNEEGSAIVLALLAIAVLTVLGVSSSDTSLTELNIVRNEQIYQINFYQAESCANEGAYYVEGESNPERLLPGGTEWMNDNDGTVDLTKSANWVDSGNDSNAASSQVKNVDNSSFSAIAEGPRDGSSLDIGSSRLYEFAIYGKSESLNGNSLVEIGYLKRF